MDDLSTISIMVASAGLLVAAAYYLLQIRNQTKMRQTDMVIRLYNTFGSTDFQEAYQKSHSLQFRTYEDYSEKYEGDVEVQTTLYSVCAYFESIGVLLHRRLISLDLIDDLLSTDIIWTWKKLEPIITGWREHASRPQIWEWFQYLYNEMAKKEQILSSTN
jgi:hypothetical protein